MASPASPPHYMYNPIKTIKTNTIGTINMLGLARRVKARLLFASTSEVYVNIFNYSFNRYGFIGFKSGDELLVKKNNFLINF